MKSYGQFCPLAQATQLLCERWTLIIVREFIAGSTRFNELRKGVPTMSPTLLSRRLKQLENAGVIQRQTAEKGAYKLTQAGEELRPVVELLGAWGHRWARTDLNQDDLDASLLMWDMRRSVDPSQFPEHRVIVQFEYPDAPKGAHDWWLISENGEIDLCLNDPGHDIDILIKCSLSTMTAIWTCQKKFKDAVSQGEISVLGDPELTCNLQDWLRSSLLSHLGTVEKIPTLDWGGS
jgi:DNA-binding HxlR family transcriptional regulator